MILPQGFGVSPNSFPREIILRISHEAPLDALAILSLRKTSFAYLIGEHNLKAIMNNLYDNSSATSVKIGRG